MTTLTAFALILLLAVAALGALGIVRVVRGDDSLDVWGHARRRPAGSLPRSHEDPFDPRSYRVS